MSLFTGSIAIQMDFWTRHRGHLVASMRTAEATTDDPSLPPPPLPPPTAQLPTPPLTPHTSLWLPDQKGHKRSPLWGVHLFHLLDAATCQHLVSLAEAHGRTRGWATGRHKHFPTTDIAVTKENAPSIYDALQPHVIDSIVLPTIAALYGHFDVNELSMADMFVVKYEAKLDSPDADVAQQDRLAFHRDGSLLSFSILLSEPSDFEGGGLRFHSLGPSCVACSSSVCRGTTCAACRAAAAAADAPGSKSAGDANGHADVSPAAAAYQFAFADAASRLCASCQGVGRAAIKPPRCGDLTTHCGKLLHEGALLTRGRRYILVGFVRVKARRIDHHFVESSLYANSAGRSGGDDYDILEEAYDPEQGKWQIQRWCTE